MTRLAQRRADAGVVLLTTLTKVVVVLAIIGTLGYDSMSMLTTHYAVRDDAQAAALAGHDALRNTGHQAAAVAAVLAYAKEHGDIVVHQGVSTTSPGKNSWSVELRKEARTMVASHVPKAMNYVTASASSTASDPLG
jgi:hypothetical protein